MKFMVQFLCYKSVQMQVVVEEPDGDVCKAIRDAMDRKGVLSWCKENNPEMSITIHGLPERTDGNSDAVVQAKQRRRSQFR